MFVNRANINSIIKEHERLVRECKNVNLKRHFENMLKSYLAIKDLFDRED